MLARIENYAPPQEHLLVEKVRVLGLPTVAEIRVRKLLGLRYAWGNEGDVAAVMELGNNWIVSRVKYPPKSKDALRRTIRNRKFCRKRIDSLWKVFTES
jgi:hypothetical protein